MNRYLVLVLRKPVFDAALIEPHRCFLADLRAQDRIELSGAFADGSGGAYLLRASTLDEATAIAHGDPLHTAAASTIVVHEWNAT